MKKNSITKAGTVSKIRGYGTIQTDFIEACKCKPDRRTSGMIREDNKYYFYAIGILLILFGVFLAIYTAQNNAIERAESMQVSAAVTMPIKAVPVVTAIVPVTEQSFESHEVFKITAYCSCTKCCGKSDGITFSGVKAVEGVTVAADLTKFPIGTEIFIEGIGRRIVQDKGGSIRGNRIDIFMSDHKKALRFGLQGKWVTYTNK